MKRVVLAIGLVVLIMLTGTAFAAGTMAVKINGTVVNFKTAPKFDNNTLMVPLEEVVTALGINAKWDVATNTLEIIDNRAQRISELEAQIKDLQAGKPAGPATDTSEPTKSTITTYLQTNFGKFSSDSTSFGVTWSHFTGSDGKELFMATMDGFDYLKYLDLRIAKKDASISAWFEGAAKAIAKAYPDSAAVLMYTGVYSSYPSAKHDSVSLTSDLKWRVTDYELWAFISNSSVTISWD